MGDNEQIDQVIRLKEEWIQKNEELSDIEREAREIDQLSEELADWTRKERQLREEILFFSEGTKARKLEEQRMDQLYHEKLGHRYLFQDIKESYVTYIQKVKQEVSMLEKEYQIAQKNEMSDDYAKN
ncbi:hypothetical protein [Listeria fleischmannii]|uniref:Uncharacterized protein n=1 Tax=Listeria fleischmannii FSL S10-1203 TaxID=1265822 RepID=W7DQS4_9LIST|nr:hypothetical protein [Listeria fleischmannii]EUJ64872.1 hypothetical protein MCOL2_01735 [Listeria fleischmannii FSL S10-1203]